ncbi:AzlD domain-containing protein [Paenibacillus glycanilyticus]|uniref:Branched-chain amino acid ABC transporter n=1 Tax=Paenibacillus glycanilyticus TaxID=126569 RepID=A0ABQ6GN83_9BACL|nr:AzlD domain-containing protein [Paenibacillus glycanilyticus]GLX70462.1 branched-chain amino acid ABC transporter [Paenibacillus glycanilyticus]
MEIRWDILAIIIGASLVTFLPRVLPLVVLSRMQIPDLAMRWLSYIPIAVMAALLGNELLMTDGKMTPLRDNIELFAALPTFLVAIFTRSLLGTIVVGVVTVMLLRFLL